MCLKEPRHAAIWKMFAGGGVKEDGRSVGRQAGRQEASLNFLSMSAAVRVGTSELWTSKGEDVHFVSLDESRLQPEAGDETPLPHMVFAVFDGHGGKRAAFRCLQDVAGRLLKGGPATWGDKDIEDVFWETDLALGADGVNDGTTATVLLVEDAGAGLPLRCIVAWVGDSAAVHVNMQGTKRDTAKERVMHATDLHSPENEAEVARLRTHWDVRQRFHQHGEQVMRELLDSVETAGELQGSEKSSSPDFRKAVPIESEAYQQMLAVLKESLRKQDVPSEEVHQYMRILHREHLIASAGPDRDPTPGLARGEPSKGASMSSGKVEIVSRGSVRRTSTIARRFGDHGPMSLRSSVKSSADTTVKDGPSTLVTRSIGDWDASRACIRTLQILRFELARARYAHRARVRRSMGLCDAREGGGHRLPCQVRAGCSGSSDQLRRMRAIPNLDDSRTTPRSSSSSLTFVMQPRGEPPLHHRNENRRAACSDAKHLLRMSDGSTGGVYLMND